MKRYLLNLGAAISQFMNTLIGGDPDMTISGRAGRAVAEGRCVLCKGLCWLLNLIDKDHCAQAARYESDEGRDQLWRL